MSTKAEERSESGGFPRPFGPYVLLQPLNRGGMGEVFLAKHGKVDGIEKFCVVKTLRRAFTDDSEYVERFIEEARVVVHLGHRNICHVFDVGKVGERYYLAMEYIAGHDLRRVQQAVKADASALPQDLVLHVGTQVLEALDYAHRHVHPATGEPLGLVHRDVSPQNVMVNLEGEVKLIDFGLAASNRSVSASSDSGVVIGKLAYMAPEQLDGEVVDPRCDVFSTAVLLYELLTGRRYYEGLDRQRIWSAIQEGWTAPRLEELEPGLRTILTGALARSPAARTSCDELVDQLERYRVQRGFSAGARQLRAFMHALFPTEQEAVQDMLRRFAAAEPGLADVEPEHTLSIASSKRELFSSLSPEDLTATASRSLHSSSDAQPKAAPVPEDTAKETARLSPTPPPPLEPAPAPLSVARSFGIGVVVVALAVAAWLGLSPPPAPTASLVAAAEPPAAEPREPEGPKAIREAETAPRAPAPPKADATTTTDAPAAAVTSTPSASATRAPPPAAEPDKPRPPSVEKKRAEAPPLQPPAASPPLAEAAVAPASTATDEAVELAAEDLTFEEKIALFETRCSALPCAKALASEFRGAALVEVETQRLATAVDEVRRCLEVCLKR